MLTWLCGIARVHIAGFYRRQGREKRIPPEKIVTTDDDTLRILQEFDPAASSLDDIINRIDAARLVVVMMSSLTEEEREVLLLRYVEELSIPQIAATMKRTEKAARYLLNKAQDKAAKAARRQVSGEW